MFLALVGSGEYLPPIEDLDRELIARLGEPPRVVCLPTAAGKEGAERIDYWMRLGIEHFTRLEAQVSALPVIDRSSSEDPGLAAEIAAANFVYLSGGDPHYLHRTLAGSRAWEAISSVLSTGGILAGCSAGAMVMGEAILGIPSKPGFGLIPKSFILPHYDEVPGVMVRLARLLTKRRLTFVGIEGFTALVRAGERYEVLGSGGVTVWNQDGKAHYTRGPVDFFP
jgi:cyanophycinase